MLSVICLLHSGVRGANQSLQNLSYATALDATMAEGKKQRIAGRFEEALQKFSRAAQLAHAAADIDREAIALVQASACEVMLFRYRAALKTDERAKSLAHEANDDTTAGAAAIGIGEIHRLLGDYPLAKKQQEEAIRLLSRSSRQDLLAQAWRTYASSQIREGAIAEGEESSTRAIAVAKQINSPGQEASGWDLRGTALLLTGHIAEAEQALNNAYSIRQKIRDERLSITIEHRAELEMRRHNYALALQLVDEAFASADPIFRSSPQYYPIHIRAQILLGLGRESEALSEFRRAVDSATAWRRGAMPGDASSTQTVALLHDIYQDYAELAAGLAVQRHDAQLSRHAFEVLAENRAASLREQSTLALSRSSRLPEHYFELLSQLQTAQARVTLGESTPGNDAKVEQIRLELSELENRIGVENQQNYRFQEKNRLQNSLRDIQSRLSRSEVVLSFCLGKRQSFLWVISGDSVNLHALPAENEIENRAKQFSSAVRSGQNIAPAAMALSRDLFGNLSADIWRKRDWIITGDGVLLSGIPFSTLPDISPFGQHQPLIANHTLRGLPSELLLLSSKATEPARRFVGIGDPIYNLADPRRLSTPALLPAKSSKSSVALGRLAGSEREVKTAAEQSGFTDVQLLAGQDATNKTLQSALTKVPAVLHFAVHVVNPEGRPDEAALALSLTRDDIPELLTREAIATYRVPGSLVVLSGCFSDQGLALPGAGLIGLSRAWLLAGAAAVVVTAWPTADDSGRFFSVFYNHLRAIQSGSTAVKAATALQQTQLEMQRGSGYRSSPSYWAAYSIVSKE
jgi:CHAT domain-containing protein